MAVDVRQGSVTVSHPKAGTLRIPTHSAAHEPGRVAIFEASYHGYDVGEEAADYFSSVLHRTVEVVGYDPDVRRREIDKSKYRFPGAVNVTAGSDGFPFSLINQASLDQLHYDAGIEPGTLPVSAFRMNLETLLVEPWIEDRLRRVQIGGLGAVVAKACSRCAIPNQVVETGAHTGLSNRLLRPTRSGWKADEDRAGKAEMYMGENLNHDTISIGQVVRVGDVVEAVGFGEPNFMPKR